MKRYHIKKQQFFRFIYFILFMTNFWTKVINICPCNIVISLFTKVGMMKLWNLWRRMFVTFRLKIHQRRKITWNAIWGVGGPWVPPERHPVHKMESSPHEHCSLLRLRSILLPDSSLSLPTMRTPSSQQLPVPGANRRHNPVVFV